MSDSPRLAAPDELDGLALSRFISRLGVELSGPCTFVWESSRTLKEAWAHWLAGIFRPLLAPALVSVHALASAMRPAEVVAVDRRVDAGLASESRHRSLAAGRAFLEGKTAMRAHREWSGFADRVAADESPGHVAVLFALQSALYHLPLASTLAAYAWLEFESGVVGTAWSEEPGGADAGIDAFSAVLPELWLAIRADRGDFEGGGPRLRAV